MRITGAAMTRNDKPAPRPFPERERHLIDDEAAEPMARLLAVMNRLRDPRGGCPWDAEQDFASIAPYTIEEAYEVADAIQRGDMDGLQEELGDLLLQVAFHSQMAEEAGYFRFEDVAQAIAAKMIRRHPHVFSDASERDAESQTHAWEAQKAAERAARSQPDPSALANIPVAMPALMRAEKLTKRAARIGFDWPDAKSVFNKLDEELGELHEAIDEADKAHIEEELGDLLFVMANLARKLGADPETALRNANAKFERRFRAVEKSLESEGAGADEATLERMERHWVAVKQAERGET